MKLRFYSVADRMMPQNLTDIISKFVNQKRLSVNYLIVIITILYLHLATLSIAKRKIQRFLM